MQEDKSKSDEDIRVSNLVKSIKHVREALLWVMKEQDTKATPTKARYDVAIETKGERQKCQKSSN